jgi:transcriptional regulator with XRE-family HTH domain
MSQKMRSHPSGALAAGRRDGTVDAMAFARASLGAALRQARQDAGMTQIELARRLGKSRTMVSRAELGRIHISVRDTKAVRRACRLHRKFADLLHAWRKGIRFESSSTRIVEHPAFRRIVAMGKPAIPLILRELEKEPSFLSWALREITGERPVPESASGNIPRIARIWLAWGRAHGYSW